MTNICDVCGYEWPEEATASFINRNKPLLSCPVTCPSCNSEIHEIQRPPHWMEQHSIDGSLTTASTEGKSTLQNLYPNTPYSRATRYGLLGRRGTIMCAVCNRPAVGKGLDGNYYCEYDMRKKYGYIPIVY